MHTGSQSLTFRAVELACSPDEVASALAARDGFVFLDSSLESGAAQSVLAWDPDTVIEGTWDEWPKFAAALESRSRDAADRGLPTGAAIGWIGYDGRWRFGFYESLLIYLHREREWVAYGEPEIPTGISGAVETQGAGVDFQPVLSRDRFEAMVGTAQEYIAAGDIYQVCLAHEFRADVGSDSLWPLYYGLRAVSPAPYAAFLNLGGTQVLSASPECFLDISGRRIRTRPIKGTRPRGGSPEHDERAACELVTSQKEIAELVMITDLERNDLGRVCEFGSVRVTDLLRLETFEQVFHLVSTVEGTLRDAVSHPDAVAACFPGGSISGAPKKRAMEIIAELEPTPRGIYTGAIGMFGFNGETRLNIAIRTIAAEEGRASFHVGAGIVADSIPEREWQETLDKASGLLAAARARTT